MSKYVATVNMTFFLELEASNPSEAESMVRNGVRTYLSPDLMTITLEDVNVTHTTGDVETSTYKRQVQNLPRAPA